jgi:hypothetical protein
LLREIDLSSERMVMIECGAGTSIPTVRNHCEALMRMGATLIRINLREPETPSRGIGVRLGALAALEALDARLRTLTNDRFRNQSDRAESVNVATS